MIEISKGDIYEVEIENIAYGGNGFAKIKGFVIFIYNTVPGDIVKVKIIKKRKNYAEANIIKFLKYSIYRVKPLCPYSGICGGCKWQFLEYKQQLFYKHKHVLELIEHISLIKKLKVNSIIPSNDIFGYRNKMEFSCSDRKWLLKSEMNSNVESWFGLGLHIPGTFYKVLDISACLLQPDIGNKILHDVRVFMKNSNQPPYGLRSHKGFWRFLVFRYSNLNNQCMINIVTANKNIQAVKPLADRLVAKYSNIVSVINNVNTKKAGIATGEYSFNLCGRNTIRDKIGQYNFDVSANSFFQTNSSIIKKLYDTIKSYASLSGNELVLDLYCGTGTISIYLSDMAKKIIGIDIVESAISDAEKNCDLNGIKNCTFILGDVKSSLSKINVKPDVLIMDPPRVGVHKEVVKKIMKMLPNRIIYVSCNPSTFARDILRLKKFYQIDVVQPIDMFPHTFHIEVVAKLSKKKVLI